MLVNPNGSGVVRVAPTNASDYTIGASFSRDGTQIAYSTNRAGDADVFVIRPDGSDQRQVTFSRGNDSTRPSRATAPGSPSRAIETGPSSLLGRRERNR